MSETLIENKGARIWTIAEGDGIPMLLCNGGPGCCDYLGPVAEMVVDISKVIRFEQRGCGRSEPVGPYDVASCISDMEAIRNYYGIDQWIVGGHSFGPNLALAYALSYPDQVLGIVGISGGVIHKDREWRAEYHRLKDTQGEVEPDYLYPPNIEVNHQVNASWVKFVRRPSLLKDLSELKVPTLFIYGDKDIRPSWPVAQTAGLLPISRFILVEGAAHLIWLSHAPEMREHLRAFITEIQG